MKDKIYDKDVEIRRLYNKILALGEEIKEIGEHLTALIEVRKEELNMELKVLDERKKEIKETP